MPDAILYEHDDGRWAVNPVTTGDPGWHRVGPVDVSALASAPAAEVQRARLEGYNTAMVWHGRTLYQAKSYDDIKAGWPDEPATPGDSHAT